MTTGDVWVEDDLPGRRGLLLDVAGAVAFGALVVLAGTAQSGWSAVAGGLLAVAVAVRRAWWWAAVATAVVAGLVQVVVGDVNVLADLGFAPVAFSLGAHPSPAVRRLGLLAASAGVVGAGVWAGLHDAVEQRAGTPALSAAGMATAAAVVLLGGWVAGYVRWQRREGLRARLDARLRAAEERRLTDLVAQEQDRVRIAADMHDVIAHSWAVVASQADGARYTMRTDPDRAEAALEVIAETARTAMTDVRSLLGRLRTSTGPGGDDLVLEDTDAVLARMRASGMRLEVSRTGTVEHDTARSATARRVVAEALTNALKHGDLTRPVHVEESWGEVYRLRVTNHRGAPAPVASGHGVAGIRERVAASGGRVRIGPDGAGSTWVVDLELGGQGR